MKYLVLGSNSFSGSSFISYILQVENNAEIFGVSRSEEYDSSLLAYKNIANSEQMNFYQYDLNKDLEKIVALILEKKIEYIINFAAQGMVAQSWDTPTEWLNTNTKALLGLVDKIYKFDFIKKFVQVSTPEVYGSCDNVKESMLLAPSSPYAASKASADLFLYAYYKTHGFAVNFTRSSNVYGPYQQLYRIIPKTVLMIKKGEKLQLHGGGKAIRSFIHIEDVNKATYTILHKAKAGEIYHLSNKKKISIYDLVELICQEMGVNITDCVQITDDRVGQDNLYLMNNEKLQKDFQMTPEYSLRKGIQEVIMWIEKNYETLKDFPDFYIHKQ